MIILIPSYEPSDRLLSLLVALQAQGGAERVVIVDDGSGSEYDRWFREAARLGAEVVRYDTNRGKGYALKVGFEHIDRVYPGQPVVCADSDGQHSPADILRVAEQLAQTDADVVLGARLFTGCVPARSRIGNALTCKAFRVATGRSLIDTQTGLRAYPARRLRWLQSVGGDRFEYELRLLLLAARERQHIAEVPIQTIYLDENASSHFRPLQDSLRIYRPLLGFAASSFAGFMLDSALLFTLVTLGLPLVGAAVAARVVSATVNFAVNRRFVFRDDAAQPRPWYVAAARYAGLAGVLLLANVVLLEAIWRLTGNLVLAKAVTEVVLFATSFLVQRTFVFTGTHRRTALPTTSGHQSPTSGHQSPTSGH